ncbi:hypothetical protein LAV73_23640 [Lysinibacillus xylanilyticus]|uniref:hypothetical protein n=1 Tax=Lysinibacillus xylanilyticus TaxID=582475 RepID=UPI002B2558C6|nr:hypothetical protein [Lysinibacillus xylanilyticus]MEB2282915.1 hypothetical protein [Lysinibacillus xylanilyticus]
MKNKLKTTPNQAVQTFITHGNQKGNRQLKEERLQQLEEVLATQGIYPGGKVHRVLEKLIYDLTYNGIIKVSREHLSNKLEVGLNTISTAFKYMEQSKLFILSRNKSGKTNSGCRVILDVQHANFESILSEVYHLNSSEIAIVKDKFKQLNKYQNKHQDLAQNAVISTPNDSNLNLNYNNQNKLLKDIKTSTKQSSDKKNNLYTRLKNLYQARKGSLEGFKSFVGVIYGSLKKIKVEDKLTLSHMQLETIMYQSLDAAISANDQYIKTNRLALLSAIIQNKIKDVTVSISSATSSKNVSRKVEQVPAWFATRHEPEEELTEEKKAYFAQERERILAKLQNI